MLEPPTCITMWYAMCLANFDDGLLVLGPKCQTVFCLQSATHRVHWVTGQLLACDWCVASWQRIADGLGMALHIERIWYERGGNDEAEQRFAAMELT